MDQKIKHYNRSIANNQKNKNLQKSFKQQFKKKAPVVFVDNEDLFNATKEGDVEKVKSSVERDGVSPDARVGKEKTPLLSIAAEV